MASEPGSASDHRNRLLSVNNLARTTRDRLVNRFSQAGMPGPYRVSLWDAGESYGGPEEGGWYYNTGNRIPEHDRTFIREKSARKYSANLGKQYPSFRDRDRQRSVLDMSPNDAYAIDFDAGEVEGTQSDYNAIWSSARKSRRPQEINGVAADFDEDIDYERQVERSWKKPADSYPEYRPRYE